MNWFPEMCTYCPGGSEMASESSGDAEALAMQAEECAYSNILVLGLGNTLMQDEGIGIEVLQRLADHAVWPDSVTLLDGGVMGLELLPYVELADAVLILDAVQTGDPPGTLARLENDEIPAVVALKMSMHQIGLQETLAMCRFRDTLPKCLVLWGVVPAALDLGLSLSPVVERQVEALLAAAISELAAWGVLPTTRESPRTAGPA